MKRILCSLLVATLPFGSVLADAPKSKNAKVTLVYQHELPNVPGKSIKGVLVEYGPGGYSPGHTHPKSAFIYATVLEGAIRSQVNDGPVTTYKAGQSFSELPGDRHGVQRQCQQDEADQAPRGVRRGHERDGPDDPIRELRFDTFRAEILRREKMRDAKALARALRHNRTARASSEKGTVRPRCPVVAQSGPNELAPHQVPIKRINSSVLFSLNFSPDWREPCHYAAGTPPSCAFTPAPARQSAPENVLAGVKLASLRIWMRFNESMTESMSRKSCSIFSILT